MIKIFFSQAFLHAEDDEEEKLLQKLLQKVMRCAFAAFPYNDPNSRPSPARSDIPDVMDNLSFFPAYPRIRFPRNYAADAPGQHSQDANLQFCRKFPSSSPTLSPGTSFTLYYLGHKFTDSLKAS